MELVSSWFLCWFLICLGRWDSINKSPVICFIRYLELVINLIDLTKNVSNNMTFASCLLVPNMLLILPQKDLHQSIQYLYGNQRNSAFFYFEDILSVKVLHSHDLTSEFWQPTVSRPHSSVTLPKTSCWCRSGFSFF